MVRKPPDWHQPSLFPTDPDKSPEPENLLHSKEEGDHHAVQDNRSRTPATANGVARAATDHPPAKADDGSASNGTQGHTHGLEGNVGESSSEQRPEPDQQRSDGTGTEGTGGSFTLRVTSERQRNALPGCSNGVHPQTHVARLKASRKQPTLFDSVSGNPPPDTPAPPGAIGDGTVLSPPGRASGNPVPPEGSPQLSAGTV